MVVFFIFELNSLTAKTAKSSFHTVPRGVRKNLNYGLRVCRIFSCVKNNNIEFLFSFLLIITITVKCAKQFDIDATPLLCLIFSLIMLQHITVFNFNYCITLAQLLFLINILLLQNYYTTTLSCKIVIVRTVL